MTASRSECLFQELHCMKHTGQVLFEGNVIWLFLGGLMSVHEDVVLRSWCL
jgi:hypothetical protein